VTRAVIALLLAGCSSGPVAPDAAYIHHDSSARQCFADSDCPSGHCMHGLLGPIGWCEPLEDDAGDLADANLGEDAAVALDAPEAPDAPGPCPSTSLPPHSDWRAIGGTCGTLTGVALALDIDGACEAHVTATTSCGTASADGPWAGESSPTLSYLYCDRAWPCRAYLFSASTLRFQCTSPTGSCHLDFTR
jgi:hypothetical protein